MDNATRLYSQVAAEAGAPPEAAMVACYLLGLSRQGRTLDAAAVAEAIREGRDGYAARSLHAGALVTARGSKAEVAMRRLSLLLERNSVEVFGCDDVRIFVEGDGARDQIAPKVEPLASKFQRVLAA